MPRTAGDYDAHPVRAYKQDTVMFTAVITIGATGAPTVAAGSDPGITVARSNTGIYDIVYPAFAGQAFFLVTPRKSATIVEAAPTAIDTAAGTATVVTRSATNTAADPANGDILQLLVVGKASSAR